MRANWRTTLVDVLQSGNFNCRRSSRAHRIGEILHVQDLDPLRALDELAQFADALGGGPATERGNAMNRITNKLLPTFAFLVTATLASYVNATPGDCARPAVGTGEVQACHLLQSEQTAYPPAPANALT
jgi:hypothetical protein